MKIEELKQKHSEIPNEFFCSVDMHTKLSVKFALELLNEIYYDVGTPDCNCEIDVLNKIEELKNYYKWGASTE